MEAPVIETERFRLRSAELRDFDAYADMWADDRTTAFIGGGRGRTRQEAWYRFLGQPGLWAMLGYGYWVFADRASDLFIGCGGFASWERGVPALEGYPEAGWAIAPAWWGKGAASEIMAAALGWADGALGGDETRCIIDHGNAASLRVAERLGYRRQGDVALADGLTTLWSRRREGAAQNPST